MPALLTSPSALALALASVFLVAFVTPVVRHRLRTGSFGITLHRREDPVQRAVGASMTVAIAALAGFVVARVAGLESFGALPPPPILVISGWSMLVLGLLVIVVGQATMGASWRIGIDAEHTALVSAGIFAFVRNPIFAGMVAIVAGVAVLSPSPFTFFLALQSACLVAIQARLEEAHLTRLHGAAYRAYAARVGRFLPGIGTLR